MRVAVLAVCVGVVVGVAVVLVVATGVVASTGVSMIPAAGLRLGHWPGALQEREMAMRPAMGMAVQAPPVTMNVRVRGRGGHRLGGS